MSQIALVEAISTGAKLADNDCMPEDRLSAAVNARPFRAFLFLTCFYLAVIAVLSSMKLLWLDELITLHIARLGSVAAIWSALAGGADPNPPLTHLAVHGFRLLFGERELALRAPAVIGYWVGLLSLFWYLKRRIPAVWALAGTVLSMAMAAFEYSYESRSYGIFYGFAMLAFFCWSVGVDRHTAHGRRRAARFGMVAALALGICTNYFAVLAFLPIAIGEATRTVLRWHRAGRGRTARALSTAVDLPIWVGMGVAALPLLVFRPLIARSIAQFAPYAWNRVSLDQVSDSYTQMVESTLAPLLALFVLAGLVFLFARVLAFRQQSPVLFRLEQFVGRVGRRKANFPPYEVAGVVGLMVYPMLGYIVASIRGGMLSPRFVIPVCFGFAIAGAATAYRLFGSLRRSGAFMLVLCVAWFCAREAYVGYWYEEQKQSFYKVLDHLPEAEREVPRGARIAIPDPLLALTFEHYASPALRRRLVFPVDFPAIRLYRHDDSPEQNLWAGRHLLYTLPIVTLAEFQRSAGRYLILAADGNWMVTDLDRHHYDTPRLPINTRAGAIGGFTPLGRGVPAFFTAHGDAVKAGPLLPEFLPVPFRMTDNLPSAPTAAAERAGP